MRATQRELDNHALLRTLVKSDRRHGTHTPKSVEAPRGTGSNAFAMRRRHLHACEPAARKVPPNTITKQLVSSSVIVGTALSWPLQIANHVPHVVNASKSPLAMLVSIKTVTVVATWRRTCNACHVLRHSNVVAFAWPSVGGALKSEPDIMGT